MPCCLFRANEGTVVSRRGFGMINARIVAAAATMTIATALAGCQMAAREERPAPIAAPQSPVDGEWMGTDGVAISSHPGVRLRLTR